MIYVSIDIETCGLDDKNHSILEFGAIIEDTDNPLPFETIPKFCTLLERPDNNYVGSPYALAMHKEIFQELAKKLEKEIL
jgi:oligoribonuclease (3'-5' exoribonuclease)